jgi:hypothetical protein
MHVSDLMAVLMAMLVTVQVVVIVRRPVCWMQIKFCGSDIASHDMANMRMTFSSNARVV